MKIMFKKIHLCYFGVTVAHEIYLLVLCRTQVGLLRCYCPDIPLTQYSLFRHQPFVLLGFILITDNTASLFAVCDKSSPIDLMLSVQALRSCLHSVVSVTHSHMFGHHH